MKKTAISCDRCGRTFIVDDYEGSTDLVKAEGNLLFHCHVEKKAIPMLAISGRYYCPDCIVKEVVEWVDAIKKISPSKGIVEIMEIKTSKHS